MRGLQIVLALFVALGLTGALFGQAQGEPTARLGGVVTAGGRPLGGATVIVNRAWPIKGLAYFCPGCYRDCGKSVETNEEGAWAIEGLDNSLKFELLVVAKGHVPRVTDPVVPALARGLTTELKARDVAGLRSEAVVRGRVVDAGGEPVEGAVVNPQMAHWEGGGCGGNCEGLDPLAVTDEDGRFALVYEPGCVSMDLLVSARGFAPTCFPQRRSGETEHVLTVREGASVGGRLVRDGKPVPDVEMNLSTDQSSGLVCYDRQTIATDKDGRFFFVNVLPGQKYYVNATTSQLSWGCTQPRLIEVKGEGAEVDVGDIEVIKGVRVSGRVLAPEGKPIPAGAKLTLSNEHGWDGVTVDLAPDGGFEFIGVPPGRLSLSLAAPGIYVSHRNPSADKLNMNRLVGRIDEDLVGLEIATTVVRPERPARPGEPEVLELGGIEGRRTREAE